MLPKTKFRFLFCAFFAVAIPAASLAQSVADGNSGLKNTVILIIRHAEEPVDGPGLSPSGIAHARAYVDYFRNFRIDGQLLKLDYIFAAEDTINSQRPRLTVEPTSQALGLAVDTRFKNRRFLELVREIQSLPGGKNILISWHHGTIPDLLRALGADPATLFPKGRWPNHVFDWLVELRYDENGRLFQSRLVNENLSFDEWRILPWLPLCKVATKNQNVVLIR